MDHIQLTAGLLWIMDLCGIKRPTEVSNIPAPSEKRARGQVSCDFLDHDARHAFIHCFKMMTTDLDAIELTPYCIQDEILSQREANEVRAKETPQDRNYHLLCTIHRKANADISVITRFRKILENINDESGECRRLEHIIEGLKSQWPALTSLSQVDAEDPGHWHAVLQTMYGIICSSVDAKQLLPDLISEEVITVAQSEAVCSATTSEQRTALLLNMVRYSNEVKICSLFDVLQSSTQRLQTLTSDQLLKQPAQKTNYWRSCEADAFKSAMGMLTVSLKEADVGNLIMCLYSKNIISESSRDTLLSPMSHYTELVRVTNVLCLLETKIRECPPVYGELIEIFTNKLQLHSIGDVLREHYSSSFLATPSVERDSGLSSNSGRLSPVFEFAQQVMELYNSHSNVHSNNQKWLYVNSGRFYINLAMIKKERVTFATADPVTKETIEGADLDSILQRKQPIEMQDIFKFEPGSTLQVILVQGAPGVGKSTFALEVSKKWSIFNEMKSFHLVLLVQLHQSYAHSATSIEDLLKLYTDDVSQIDFVAKFISSQQGKGLLLILDGFDELPADMTAGSDSLYVRLLAGNYLPKATVILTTRPSVIGRIEQVCDTRISKNVEILGFLSTDINKYAEKYFDNQEATDRFLNYIYSYPHIKSMMYIPLNTAIVVELYCNFTNKVGQQLPLTLTQLYSELCLYLIQCYAKSNMSIQLQHLHGDFLSCLESMPDVVWRPLKDIAKVAFCGISKQTIIFNDLPPDFEHMNFLNKCERLVHFGSCKQSSFNFLHLTLQEFLAAFYISMQQQDIQLDLLQQYHSEPHFSHIWRFLAGLTSFKAIGWDVFADTMRVSKCGSDMKMCSSLIANCLYETQDPSICSQVYSSGHIVYSPMSATQYDYYTLGYCISNSPCKWKLCSVGGDGLAMLAAGITSTTARGYPIRGMIELIKLSYNGEKIQDLVKLPQCMLKSLIELNLSNCDLKNSGCNCLAELLPNLPSLERLDLGDNLITEGGTSSLLQSLSRLPKFHYLDLLHAKLGVEDVRALGALIHPCGTLTNVVVGSTTMSLTAKEEMVEVVLQDSNVRSISIMNLDLAQSGRQLRRKLEENTTLHKLMLWDRSFCIEGCVEVVRALENNHTLQHLTLMPWYKFHIPESLFEHKSRINWFLYH